jgi:protein-tyrosine-phosphatase
MTNSQPVTKSALKHCADRWSGEKEKQQLIPEMINTADLVVVIAEKERWPTYLQECNKVLFWDIQDPVGMADESADQVYREVRRRVEELVAEIGCGLHIVLGDHAPI